MSRNHLFLRVVLLGALSVGVVGLALGQAQTEGKKVNLKVIVPHPKATLWIQGVQTKQTGKERTFESPPLEPNKEYKYTLKAFWEPNNYTKITRIKEVTVQAGKDIEVDMTQKDPKFPDDILVRYVPTPHEIVEEMCKLGKVTKDDVVYDLGCGDGRMVIKAVQMFGAKRGKGIDIDPIRVKECQRNAKEAKVEDRVTFEQGDVLKIDSVADASVVLIYMGNDLNNGIKPMLRRSLKPGSRVVSHRFTMGDWKPTKSITVKGNDGDEYELHLWVIGDDEKKGVKKDE
jgi:uncharacterized protein (TIGR03000 family)